MKLFVLKRTTEKPIYDVGNGKVIRASTEGGARTIANTSVGDEGEIWGDPDKVTCSELLVDGDAGIILEDCNPG